MSNVLSEAEKQNVIALGRLGWSLRRIEQEIGVRRETASAYLKAAGIPVSRPGRRKQGSGAKPAISANQVTTDSGTAQPVPLTSLSGKNRRPSPSTCEPFREAIELGLSQGRNAMGIWQDLVSQAGFHGGYQTVKRFVRKLAGPQTRDACAVIVTQPGEDYGECRVMVRSTMEGSSDQQQIGGQERQRFP